MVATSPPGLNVRPGSPSASGWRPTGAAPQNRYLDWARAVVAARPSSAASPGTWNTRGMSLHVSETVERRVDEVYAYASDPSRLPEWAAGLSESIAQVNGQWVAESPMGRVVVEFASLNEYGVLDHIVVLPNGDRIYNPMRVIPHGDVSEVVFTLRRQPG
jgi:hypothetical protein